MPHGHMAVGQNQWYHFGVGAPPRISEPILVVGLGRSLGVQGYATWPYVRRVQICFMHC